MMPFSSDPAIPVAVRVSPNFDERRNSLRPSILLLHYTGMPTAEAALERLCTAGTGVSSHYFVYEDGRVVQSVPEAKRAWHAGAGSWRGEDDINSRSIGIEIVNPGHDHGYADFPAVQIAAVIALSRDIIRRHAVRPERVLAHSDIAPARKTDPGERFPWQELHAAGIGHWIMPLPPGTPGDQLSSGATGPGVADLQRRLQAYGYGISISGQYDTETELVVAAFQRHFRPALVDGVADASTLATLTRLQAALEVPAVT